MRNFARSSEPPGTSPPAEVEPFAASGDVVAWVSQLDTRVEFTNLDKVLYEEQALNKAALIAYYAVIADRLLEHAACRPLAIVRCPDGRHKFCFFQKHAKAVPDAIGRVRVEEQDGTVALHMQLLDRDSLFAMAQLGVLELHLWGSRSDAIDRPDRLVFDLDPGLGVDFGAVIEAAFAMREHLGAMGLESFPLTTGGKGLHVVAPVRRRTSWDAFKAFAKAVAQSLERQAPERYVTNPLKRVREGKIFLDYLRNGRGATAIAPYSTRAREGAPVATPVDWRELEAGIDPRAFTVATLPRRLATLRRGAPWRGYFDVEQSITAAMRRKVGLP